MKTTAALIAVTFLAAGWALTTTKNPTALPELSLQRSAPDTTICAGVVTRTKDCPDHLRGTTS